ncbi:MAG: hypothetical protein HYT80_09710 [Euryarchaeota archaeon]|nr:hypothetical protein [Euryarchaeota archaeon]
MARFSWIVRHADILSVLLTLLIAALVALYAVDAAQRAEENQTDHKTRLALATGALGGLAHELIQSRGKLLFFRRAKDGLQLGSVSSLAMGAIAGGLAVNTLLAPGSYAAALPREIAFQAFTAGLALKGLAGAATGAIHHATDTLADAGATAATTTGRLRRRVKRSQPLTKPLRRLTG